MPLGDWLLFLRIVLNFRYQIIFPGIQTRDIKLTKVQRSQQTLARITMEDKVERAVAGVNDALKLRRYENEVEHLKVENERLQAELNTQRDADFEALLSATLIDPAGFIERLKEKRIRLPVDGTSVDVDSLKVGGEQQQ